MTKEMNVSSAVTEAAAARIETMINGIINHPTATNQVKTAALQLAKAMIKHSRIEVKVEVKEDPSAWVSTTFPGTSTSWRPLYTTGGGGTLTASGPEGTETFKITKGE